MEEQLVGEIRGYMEALSDMCDAILSHVLICFDKIDFCENINLSLEKYYSKYITNRIKYQMDFEKRVGVCFTKMPEKLEFRFELQSIEDWKERIFDKLDFYFLHAFDDKYPDVAFKIMDREDYERRKSNCFNGLIKKIETLLCDGEITVCVLDGNTLKYSADGKQNVLVVEQCFDLNWNHIVFKCGDRLYLLYLAFSD